MAKEKKPRIEQHLDIGKQANQTWEQWFAKLKQKDTVVLPWNWKFDRDRKVMKRWARKGYFYEYSTKGRDKFIRSGKVFVPGDSPKKSVSFSRGAVKPNMLPAIPPNDYKGSVADWMIALQQQGLWDGQNPEWHGDVIIPVDIYNKILAQCESEGEEDIEEVTLEINKAKYDALKKAHTEAVRLQMPEFNFQGSLWVTDYAKQILEFVAPQFENMK